MTIAEFLEEIIRVFTKAGIENPGLEAQLLACHILSCDRVYLFTHRDEELDDKVLLASAALINQRTEGRPLQYIVGSTDFYGVRLAVDERVLIPRPETEQLVDQALNELKNIRNPRILDLCTGSGCIAAALAEQRKDAVITASELSPKAYMLARVNLRPYANVKIVRGDLFEPFENQCDGLYDKADCKQSAGVFFDAIVTNPPYVESSVIETLAREVKDYEPHMALDGGSDGLDLVKKILQQAPAYLSAGGFLFMEIGWNQGSEVKDAAEASGSYASVEILKDLAGKDRILKAQLRG